MTTTTVSPAVSAFVESVLAAGDAAHLDRLAARPALSADEVRQAVPLIVEGAILLLGVDPLRMERLCALAAALADRVDDAFLRALALHRTGDALRAQGRNREACTAFDAAASIFSELGRPREAARTRVGWVVAAANLGRLTEALAGARVAARLLARFGDTDRVANLQLNVGNIHFEQGQYRTALLRFGRAQAAFEALGESGRLGAARCLANRGYTLARLGRQREALKLLESARLEYEALGENAGHARVVRNIGLTQMELGRYAAALRAFDQVRPRFLALGLHSELVVLANYVAECYLYLNRPADALSALAEAEDSAQQLDSMQDALGRAVHRVAAHLANGNPSDALADLDEAEAHDPGGAVQHRAWLAAQRAAALLRDRGYPEALANAERAERLARAAGMRRLVAMVLNARGEALLALGRTHEADRALDRARRLAQAEDAAPVLGRTLETMGRVAEQAGRTSIARRRYAAAIGQLEREQRGVIFEFRDQFAIGRGGAYERLARLDLVAGRPAEALATAERAKSRALAEAISHQIELRPRSATGRRLARELVAAREDYAAAFARAARDVPLAAGIRASSAVPELATLEAHIAALIQQLQLAGAIDEAGDLYGAPALPALPDLPADVALVEYFVSGDEIIRFLVTSAGVEGVLLPGSLHEVERLIRALHLNLEMTAAAPASQRPPLAAQIRGLLSRLHERLFAGLEALRGCRSLVIVPHGRLHYLPFHALFDGERYLVEQFAISYAPSAAIYQICRQRGARRRRGPALVLAHSGGGQLPHALREAQAVAAVVGAPVRGEAEATRARLRGEGRRARLIHVAAHGQFRPDAPLFSAVELDDGPLTTADVFGLDLSAELVTLSACETAHAVLGGGDELVGLSRAFLYAGAASLVVSQWRVDDASSAALMGRFYTELAHGTGRAEALRRAQIAQLSVEAPQSGETHPFLWAGFQLIGTG